MKRLGVILAALACLAFAPPPNAAAQNQTEIVLAAVYDLDAAAYTYCRTVGMNGRADDQEIPGRVLLSTSGSSTTVTGTNAFANVAVGDILFINDQGVIEQRTVTARASASSITVNAAVNITSAPFNYRKLQCGTADTSGAFAVDGWTQMTVQVILAQENSASTDYKIQCRLRGPGTAWSDINGPNNDTTTFNDIFATTIAFGECRVGAQVNTDDGGDTGVNAEQLTILVTGYRR